VSFLYFLDPPSRLFLAYDAVSLPALNVPEYLVMGLLLLFVLGSLLSELKLQEFQFLFEYGLVFFPLLLGHFEGVFQLLVLNF